jgi:hypothetical protein
MEKELEHIIIQKTFEELSSSEKEQLKEWCSTEEEFNQLKMLYSEIELMNSENSLKTKASTKRNLDELFEKTHSKGIWYSTPIKTLYPQDKIFIRRPLVQIAAVLAVLFLAYPLFNEKLSEIQPKQMAELNKAEIPEMKAKKNEIQSELEKGMPQNEINFVPPIVSDEDVNYELSESSVESTSQDDFAIAEIATESKDSEGISELNSVAEMSVASAPKASVNGFTNHSDGIYIEEKTDSAISLPASRKPEMLDLLTAAF